MRLQLYILAQAIEDVLRYELGEPLVGAPEGVSEDEYFYALSYVMRYPSLQKRLAKEDKRSWLKEIEDART